MKALPCRSSYKHASTFDMQLFIIAYAVTGRVGQLARENTRLFSQEVSCGKGCGCRGADSQVLIMIILDQQG